MSDCVRPGETIIPPEYPPGGDCDCGYLEDLIAEKQDRLTAGANITIENNVISATGGGGGSYVAGTNIDITGNTISAPNVYSKTETDALIPDVSDFITCEDLGDCQTISDMQDEIDGKQDQLTAGANIQIAQDGTISATDTTYQNATQSTAGLMSAADKTKLDGIDLTDYLTCEDVLECQDVIDALDAKQDVLTAGYGIDITNGVISSTIDEDLYIVVQSLPQTGEDNKVYLVPKQGGGFSEWAYINGAWEEIGDTDIDLSNYYTKTEADALLADKADASSVYTKTETDNLLADKLECSDLASCQTIIDMNTAISGKQDALTAGSNIQIAQDGTISATDTTYTAGSNITISNGAISATFTKAELLTILGYSEIPITMTDTNNNTVSITVLGVRN